MHQRALRCDIQLFLFDYSIGTGCLPDPLFNLITHFTHQISNVLQESKADTRDGLSAGPQRIVQDGTPKCPINVGELESGKRANQDETSY